MAEGWARTLKNDEIDSWSAGIEKHGLNPLAVKAMAEAGGDISRQKSKVISELPVKEFDWVVTLCGHADETCPFFPGRRIHVWFDDPSTLAAGANSEDEKLIHYRRVRDEIRTFILSLPDSLSK